MIYCRSNLTKLSGLLFILSLVSLVINFADTTLRVDDINRDSIQEVVSESTDKYKTGKFPTPKLTEDDYNYFPFEDLTEKRDEARVRVIP